MVKKIKSHKDVQLPFGSGKTDTKPWVPRPPVPKAGKGGSPGQPYDIPRPDIPHPNPPKYAKKKSKYSRRGPASA